jgi:hypothetical protein
VLSLVMLRYVDEAALSAGWGGAAGRARRRNPYPGPFFLGGAPLLGRTQRDVGARVPGCTLPGLSCTSARGALHRAELPLDEVPVAHRDLGRGVPEDDPQLLEHAAVGDEPSAVGVAGALVPRQPWELALGASTLSARALL